MKRNIKISTTDKELYRIFKDLEKYGRTTFNYPDRKLQQSIARKIGLIAKEQRNEDTKKYTLFPPARTRNRKLNIIALPTNIVIKEKKKGIFKLLRE